MHEITFEATVTIVPTPKVARAFRDPEPAEPRGRAYAVRLEIIRDALGKIYHPREGDRLRLTVDSADPERIIAAEVVPTVTKRVAARYATAGSHRD